MSKSEYKRQAVQHSVDPVYPQTICYDCGNKLGKAGTTGTSTYHLGVCGWCLREESVTEPRDFGYPKYV